ncbi:hypothetical protein EON82_15950 [bacterium]|nr:MAG: hypothetical protein EON82_15950 [bacterium]
MAAQRYFDQGLAFLYGFNKPESFQGFSAAARLDPKCAMAWWGVAAAKAPDINSPEVTAEDSKIAIDALAKASALAGSATPADRAMIAAERLRFGDQPRSALNFAHANAMRQAWHRFPRDPDVGARFADALLNRRPWDQWLPSGAPQPGTLEATDVLGKVLALSPRHPLALHLTIHAWEASPHPERAATAANRLRLLQPALGHMVHMPSHIDVRTGDWKKAIASNELGIRADLAFRKVRPAFDPYLFYTAHNYHMLGFSAMMSGQRKKAIAAMDAVVGLVPTAMQKDLAPLIDGMYAMPYEARIRFGLWDEILAQPELPSYFPLANALRHAARGVAFAAKGDTFAADSEALEFANAEAGVKRDENYDHTPNGVILDIARSLLAGEILLARGKTDDAIVELRKAVESENKVRYSEPPDWVLPTRHVLGVALLKAKRPTEAERVYRESLKRIPNDGWALRGLGDALMAQGKTNPALAVRKQFARAWADADTKIGSSCLCVPKP